MRPPTARTLVELLQSRAVESERAGFTCLQDGEGDVSHLSYAELERAARRVAAHLEDCLAPGARALLVEPRPADFLPAFFGCLFAGVVAVPVYPPLLSEPTEGIARLQETAHDADVEAILTTSDLVPLKDALADRAPRLSAVPWIAADALRTDPADWIDRGVGPDSLAFLQYTSGSTTRPRGVMLRHRHLLANERHIQEAFALDDTSTVVSWLPVYHDMGLIGCVLQPLYVGCRSVLMSPIHFLQRPARWLEAITRYRGTCGGGPNFGYELCVRKVSDAERAGLDLSSWSLAFSGAEPVRSATLRRFAERFAPVGFSQRSLYPCYGLAEAALLVTGSVPGDGARVLEVDPDSLERAGAEAPLGRQRTREIVSCGRPPAGQEIAIVDPDTRVRMPPGRVGEIWVRGDNVATGYWRRPEESAATFQAKLADEADGGGFLRTGDLGFVSDGMLAVTGRLKEILLVRGRTIHPFEVEDAAQEAHPDLRRGGGAAFELDDGGETRFVLVQEVAPDAELEAAARAARRGVAERLLFDLDEIVLVRARSLAKTSSGKARRGACRTAYRKGHLEPLYQWTR